MKNRNDYWLLISKDQHEINANMQWERDLLTSLVKIKYRLAFVFSYERFEYFLICTISIGPSAMLRPILNFPTFRNQGDSLEL